MPIPTGVWGIDLGQCALKAVRLQEVDGQLTATAFDYVEYPKILSQPDADPDLPVGGHVRSLSCCGFTESPGERAGYAGRGWKASGELPEPAARAGSVCPGARGASKGRFHTRARAAGSAAQTKARRGGCTR